ncbi:MAG: GMC family oxidoreductase N-terminal domain-containing protein [Salinarimonas sp.]|nr:GMC family oxidoreductase N-terminal domain-containing protein [Salinarimonas sp.]
MSTQQQDNDAFDYVIVGAGAAGCLLAKRLSEDGRYTICLLEAGPPDRNINLHVPGGFIKAVTNPKYAWQFSTEPGEGIGGRRIAIPQGRTLGGSTAINGFNYNRGQPADYDTWAQQGNRGWGYDDVLPYFRRTERRMGAHDAHYRGGEGGLTITDCDWQHPLCEAFIEAAVSEGLPRNPDYNAQTQKGVGYFQRWIRNGWRVSAATAFLRPAIRSGRVDLRCNAHTTAITFDGRRATGIRYAQGRGGAVREVRARREVILACGGANSPKLLQLSGIGPAETLAGLGITPIHTLAGVGANLRDHYMVRLVARAKGVETINDMARGVKLWREIAKWAIGRPSILAVSPSVAYGFANARDLSLEPDIQLNFTPGSYMKSVTGVLDSFPGMTLGSYQLRPESSGYVRARSPDPFDDPVIQPNYLMHAEDCAVAVAGIKLVRRLLESPAFAHYHDGEVSPGADIRSDDELLAFARENGSTAYHLIGACRMGPKEDATAVVDDGLRVYGIEGLRVADSSIMPTMPSANTCAATYMIAEKAADLILERQAPASIEMRRAS